MYFVYAIMLMAILPLGVVITSWVISVAVYASSKSSPPEEYATYGPRRPLAGNLVKVKVKRAQEETGERLCASHWAVTGPHQSVYVKVPSKDEYHPLLSPIQELSSRDYYSTHSDPVIYHGV